MFGTSNRLIGIVVAGDDTSCLRFPCRFWAAPQSPSNAADRHHGDSSDGYDVCRNERVGSSRSGLRESHRRSPTHVETGLAGRPRAGSAEFRIRLNNGDTGRETFKVEVTTCDL